MELGELKHPAKQAALVKYKKIWLLKVVLHLQAW